MYICIFYCGGARPELKIELVEPSYFHLTLPRMGDTADGLHFLKHGDPTHRSEVDFAGDLTYCKGDVGEAFARLLLDQICDYY
jgi:hypothetical protein